MARLYLLRRQYEGVKAVVAKMPADSPDYSQGLLLLVQAYRGEQNYPETLRTLAQLEGKILRKTTSWKRPGPWKPWGIKTRSRSTRRSSIFNLLPRRRRWPGPAKPGPGAIGGGL